MGNGLGQGMSSQWVKEMPPQTKDSRPEAEKQNNEKAQLTSFCPFSDEQALAWLPMNLKTKEMCLIQINHRAKKPPASYTQELGSPHIFGKIIE